MSDSMEIIFLGSGTSQGIPMIGCQCAVCRSSDARDKRFRSSIAIQLPPGGTTDGRVMVVDMSPEFRLAAIANRLPSVNAILLTHAHADHIMGMDDIRRYNDIIRSRICCYGNAGTVRLARQCFAYADRPYMRDGWPALEFVEINAPQQICGVTVTPIGLLHGRAEVLGFRVGNFAYCTDCSVIPETSRPLLQGLDLLVLDGLRYTPHPTHFNIPQALEVIARLKPRRALLTHIAHEVMHAKASAELPPGVELACDNLRVQVEL